MKIDFSPSTIANLLISFHWDGMKRLDEILLDVFYKNFFDKKFFFYIAGTPKGSYDETPMEPQKVLTGVRMSQSAHDDDNVI